MTSRQQIRAYLHALAARLDRLERSEVEEVTREIESHLYDLIDQAEAQGDVPDVAALIAGFGPPDVLAAQYVAHLRDGAPPPTGFRVIQRVKQTVSRGLYYSTAASGLSIAAAFLLLAVAKIAAPASIGLWSQGGGSRVWLAWSGAPDPNATELLGFALVPGALLAAAWCASLTRSVLRVLKRGLA